MKILIASFIILASGCAHKVTIMQANAVSMTKRNLSKGEKLTMTGPVNAKFCPESFKASSGETMGLIDEAVKAAQEQNNVDFIINATIFAEGGCYGVEGDGAKAN